jgi:hypothetical protein
MMKHPEVTRETALKFLLGRKFNAERAEECFKNYQNVVLEHHFEDLTVADVLEEMRTNKLYIPGTRDRCGAALFIINAAKHVPGQFSLEDTLKLAFYMGEVLTANPKTSEIGVTIISNMEGMEWSNFDNNFQRSVINLFQNNIPARVKTIILYKSPWWVTMMVKMLSPFLKAKMRDRIHICGENELMQYVEQDQLPMDLGGSFDYNNEAFLQREMARVPTAILSTKPMAALEEDEGLPEPPPGTLRLVSDEMADDLNRERTRAIEELDERIRLRRETLKAHTLPLDINKIIQSRAARLSLDLTTIPSLEPNLLHLRDIRQDQPSALVGTQKSPLAERPGEDYDPVNLQERIAKSIAKDRVHFLHAMRQAPDDKSLDTVKEEESGSEVSFVAREEQLDTLTSPPKMPESRTQFSSMVPVKVNPVEASPIDINPVNADPPKVGPSSPVTPASTSLVDDDDDDEKEQVERGRRKRKSRDPERRRRQHTAIILPTEDL